MAGLTEYFKLPNQLYQSVLLFTFLLSNLPTTTSLPQLSPSSSSGCGAISSLGDGLVEIRTEQLSCTGAFVSDLVVVTGAHCVADRPVLVAISHSDVIDVENIIIHPDYNASHPSGQHDLALVKLAHDAPVSNSKVCLPQVGDDPVNKCKLMSINGTENVEFAPSISCMETPFLNGYIESSDNLMCKEGLDFHCREQRHQIAVCSMNGKQHIVGLEAGRDNWCHAGALTRIAKYVSWIRDTVEYLDGTSLQSVTDNDENEEDENESNTPCSSNPCGSRAVCWDTKTNFMCTCDENYPEGNPYFSCHECLYDEHCKSKGGKCIEKTCRQERDPDVPFEYSQVSLGIYFDLINHII